MEFLIKTEFITTTKIICNFPPKKLDTILDIKVKEGDTYDLNCVADKTYTHCSWQHLGTKEKCTFNNNLNHDVCNINSNSWIVENRIIGILEFPRSRQ